MNQKPESAFISNGGLFPLGYHVFAEKVKKIKVLVFDWDGVFNSGKKEGTSHSGFSEPDSMGVNMLRFGLWLKNNKQMPLAFIISGAENDVASYYGTREHFHDVFTGIKSKDIIMTQIQKKYGLHKDEIAFFFDDIIDLSAAQFSGLSIFFKRSTGHLFNQYVINKGIAHYVPSAAAGDYALRESCELILGSIGVFDEVVEKRVEFSGDYEIYLNQRNEIIREVK